MRESESFDAFYARTVRSVTGEMQSFTRDAEQTEYAVREAYARAFQQWYEVSGFRDAEGWVLDAAKEIFRRHASAAGGAAPSGAAARGVAPGGDGPYGGLIPGPAAVPPHAGPTPGPAAVPPHAGPTPGPAAGLPAAGLPAAGLPAAGLPGAGLPGAGLPAAGPPGAGLPSGTADPTTMMAGPRFPTFGEAAPAQTTPGSAGDPYGFGPQRPTGRFTAGGRRPRLPGLQAHRGLIAVAVAVVIVVAAVGAYFAFGGHSHTHRTAGSHPKVTVPPKPKPHMLAAGKVGGHRSIPWSLVTSGWTLAELSSALPNASGGSAGGGTSTVYLVDPKGGRYFINQWTSEPEPTLLAWSGDGHTALLETTSNAAGVPSFSYSLLTVATGQVAGLPLPADVTAVGFTRPDGLAILAVRQSGGKLQLQRYTFSGSLQATIGSMSHNPAQPGFEPGNCGSYCGALSSPKGDTDVWGTRWNTMRLVSNAGGKVIRKFHVGSRKKSAPCAPVSWWNDTTVLADCAASQPSSVSGQLWLVPEDGAAPTPLAAASGTPQGVGFDLTATQAGSTTYVTQTSSSQCPGAATGPGGLSIEQVGTNGALTNVAIPDSTSTRNTVLTADGTRLLVLAQTSCPGSYSLLWFYPSKDTSQLLLSAPSGKFGVIAAVPFSTL
jgi:hypothetical protein